MRGRGLKVGKLFGIDIILDASWFLIAFLMAWSFAGIISSESDLGLPQAESFGLGIAASVLFFASLLAHEISHALVARRRGIGVASITLFVFGGVAQIKQDPRTPGDEFRIAVIGPVVSLVLGGALIGLGILASVAHFPVASAIFSLIGSVNLVLAVFNLLPGFPLDGGRLLRAAVWKVTGDVVKATRIASRGGQVVAGLLIAFGLLRIIAYDQLFGGIWMILIGVFLSRTAAGSYQQVVARRALEGLAASDLMTPDPVCLPGNIRLDEAVDRYFLVQRHTTFPVIGYAGNVEGIVTLQLIRSTPRERWGDFTARQVMVPLSAEISAAPSESVRSLLERMAHNPVGRFLVMEGERLMGILSAADIARRLRVQAWIGGRT